MDDFEVELKTEFLEEVEEMLLNTEQSFLDLEGKGDTEETLEGIFRLAHNIKGSSAAVGFDELSNFTHNAENFLLKIKEKEIPINESCIDLLLRINDELKGTVESLKQDLSVSLDYSKLIEEMNTFSSLEKDSESYEQNTGEKSERDCENSNNQSTPAFIENTELVQEGFDDLDIANSTSDSVDGFSEVDEGLKFHNLPKKEQESKKSTVAASSDESIRVPLSRIDRLMNNVGELVILDNVLSQQLHEVRSVEAKKTLGQVQKIIREIQEVSMGFRMLPIKNVFQKMQRIVRDTSKSLGKEVELNISGEHTEVDKTVLEQISDPLTHLVRNAVDHGIEDSETRAKNSKPEKANVYLEAFYKGNNIIIQVRDDGGGIDPDSIKVKALEKGVLGDIVDVSDKEAIDLIFHPGLSTKEDVSDLSGRGVGMDVVKSNINELKGEIKVDSTLGQGSTFTIVLPLTLAIIDGLVVRSEERRFVVPVAQVLESIHPKKEDIKDIRNCGKVLNFRDRPIPLIPLSEIVGIKENTGSKRKIALVIDGEKKGMFAILVDDITSKQQVVIKKLSDEIGGTPGVSGAAILGDGKAVPILDVNEVIKDQPKAKKKGAA